MCWHTESISSKRHGVCLSCLIAHRWQPQSQCLCEIMSFFDYDWENIHFPFSESCFRHCYRRIPNQLKPECDIFPVPSAETWIILPRPHPFCCQVQRHTASLMVEETYFENGEPHCTWLLVCIGFQSFGEGIQKFSKARFGTMYIL